MDTTMPHQTATIATALSSRIYSGIRGLQSTEDNGVLEFLHTAYADVQGQDSEELKQYFVDLDNHLKSLSLEKNNEIFNIVCSLCSAYEKRAFLDGIRVGTCLVLELQGN